MRRRPKPVLVTENAPHAPTLPPRPLAPTPRHGERRKPINAKIFADTPLTIAFKNIRPSWRNYIDYVDIAARNGDKDMDKVLKIYLALTPKDQRVHSPEQLCELAQIPPSDLVGAVCREIWSAKSAESALVSAIAHPQVMNRMAKLAQKEENYRDRELFLRASGSLPDKKGASVAPPVVNVNVGQGSGSTLISQGGHRFTELADMDDETVIESGRAMPSLGMPKAPVLITGNEDEDIEEE